MTAAGAETSRTNHAVALRYVGPHTARRLILGGVSLLMDVSSEMIHSLLPLFMATTLGVSVIVIGLIEGLAEATALVVKVFSGVLSDYLGKRKGLALLGYGLGAISKPFLPSRRRPAW